MFKVKDFVVYAGHGVCNVKRIETKTIADKRKDFYVLQLLSNQMALIVPTDSTLLRSLINSKELDSIKAILRTQFKVEDTTWNKRYKRYMELIKTGNPLYVARVVSSLHTLKGQKDLSFGERKMLDHAIQLLSNEIQYAFDVPEESAMNLILNELSA